MPLSYRELSAPPVEPVSLALAKQHLRVYFTQDDAYIGQLITAAREYVERQTNRAIFNRPMLLTLDYFPWPGWDSTTGSTAHDYFMHWYYRGLTIRLPKPATVSVESLTYLATDGVTTMYIDTDDYIVDTTSEPARIAPRPGYTWPYQQNYVPGQVQVNYTAGTYEKDGQQVMFEVGADGVCTITGGPNVTITAVNEVYNPQVPSYFNPLGQVISDYYFDGTNLNVNPSLAGQMVLAICNIGKCPQSICYAILLLVSHWYYHRDAVSAENLKNVPLAVDELLATYTCESFAW